jgi:hypothetical protein
MIIRITIAAALMAFAASAFAASPTAIHRGVTRHDPLMGYSAVDPTVVVTDGAYVGGDPDPNIRAELRRFPGPYVSGGF